MIGKAQLGDVKDLHRLVNSFADRGRMLALSLSELYDGIRDFAVACDEAGPGRELVGCCALRVVWENLAEVRSLAVTEKAQGRGIGRALVERCLDEARSLGVARVFALTYIPEFFAKFGFALVDKADLPHKVWADCVKCPKFPNCDEVAVVLDL